MALAASPRVYVHSPGQNGGPYVRALSPLATPAAPASTSSSSSSSPQAPPPPAASPVDYTTLLKNDGLLSHTLDALNAQGITNQAGLTAAQQRALVLYGGVPSSALPGVAGVDQTTRDLASQNTSAGLSTLAKLTNQYKQNQQVSDASLAARGMLRSGAYGQHAAENLLGYNQAQDTATQQLLDYLSGVYQGYLQQQQTLSGQAYGAQNDALTRLIQQIQAGLITGAAPVPGVQVPASGGYTVPGFTNEGANNGAGINQAAWDAYLASRRPGAQAVPA